MKLCGDCSARGDGGWCRLKGRRAPYNRLGCADWGAPLPTAIEGAESVKRRRTVITPELRQAVVDAHDSGKENVNQIAKAVGVSWKTAAKILEDHQAEPAREINVIEESAMEKIMSALEAEAVELEAKAETLREDIDAYVDAADAREIIGVDQKALPRIDPREVIRIDLEASQKALALIDTVREIYNGGAPVIEQAVLAHYRKCIAG